MKTTIISLGGSLVCPGEIDTAFLSDFRKLILDYIERGNRVIIVCGGGAICRKYQKAAEEVTKVSHTNLDWVGIAATRINAELVRAIFSEQAYKEVVVNPTRKVNTVKKIIIGCGWLPGCSSDKDAVLWARSFGAKRVINMSNIDYIYDKDPRKFKDAKQIKKISWNELLKITGTKWIPGKNVPFDPEAAKLAKKLGLEVVVLNGKNLKNFKNCLEGKKFAGSVIR